MQTLLPTLAILLCHFLTGTASVCTRYLVSFLDPVEIAFLRYLFGGLALLPLFYFYRVNVLNRVMVLKIISLGVLFFAVFPFLFSWAFVYTNAARGALVLATMPIWTMIILKIMGYEKASGLSVIATCLALVGLAVALSDKLFEDSAEITLFKGELIMLVTALVGAIYSIFSRKVLRYIPASNFTPIAMLAGCSFLLPFAYHNGITVDYKALSSFQMGIMAYLGVFAGGLAFFLFNWSLNRTTATFATLFVTVNPVTAIFLGNLFLDETIKQNFIIGVLIVFAGLGLAVYSQQQEQ